MPKTGKLSSYDLNEHYAPLLQLWILQLMVKCNGADSFLRETRFSEASVAEFLGFQTSDLDDYSPAWALRTLTEKLEVIEAEAPKLPESPVLARNLARLAERLGLSQVEVDILHFAVLQRVHPVFDATLELVGELVRASLVRLLSVCLGHSERAVQDALRDDGRLCRSAILSVDERNRYNFGSKVDLLSGLAEALTLEQTDLLGLFATSFCPASNGQLTLADFAHLSKDIAVLKPYLEVACRTESRGVNVLIHGVPGTGKTEFVKALADAINVQLMTVPTETPCGQPRAGKERFESLRFAQSLLGDSGRSLLLFDEVEDVFYSTRGEGRFGGNASGIKGWVNGLLESNTVPVVWVTNCLDHIDPAYLRRFDYILKMEPPPSAVRRKILDQALGELPASEGWRKAASDLDGMTAATLRRAVKVAVAAADANLDLEPEAAVSRVLAGTLDALGNPPLQVKSADPSLPYRLDWLNADANLEQLAAGLARHRSGRVCLWGPPGTGKSEFAKHVAQLLERPCMVKRASDILSPYVGVAERNIARMFQHAASEGAVLILDEADSFLRERTGAKQGWEVTQVNEMLTAMESFDGVFVASTNLMDDIDQAALRRFDACVRLDFLKPHQVGELFVDLAGLLSVAYADADLRRAQEIAYLTPGDFAVARRGALLNPLNSSRELVARLEALARVKRVPKARTIGFVH